MLPCEDLAGIEDPLRIEDRADLRLEVQLILSELISEPAPLEQADAMLPRQRAAQLQGDPEDLSGGLPDPLGDLIVADQEDRVQVAVAGVGGRGDEDPVTQLDLADALEGPASRSRGTAMSSTRIEPPPAKPPSWAIRCARASSAGNALRRRPMSSSASASSSAARTSPPAASKIAAILPATSSASGPSVWASRNDDPAEPMRRPRRCSTHSTVGPSISSSSAG